MRQLTSTRPLCDRPKINQRLLVDISAFSPTGLIRFWFHCDPRLRQTPLILSNDINILYLRITSISLHVYTFLGHLTTIFELQG
jgi:hypothetical protein